MNLAKKKLTEVARKQFSRSNMIRKIIPYSNSKKDLTGETELYWCSSKGRGGVNALVLPRFFAYFEQNQFKQQNN